MSTTETKLLHGVIDPAHSKVQFKVKHLMISNVLGVFREFEGKASMIENDFSSAVVNFSINTASIDTEVADRDAHLKSADFFDVENYPKIEFEGKGMTQKDEDNYELKGNLTIKGVSKPITLSVEFGGLMTDPWGNKKAGFSVTGEINRKDWGMGWNAALEAGGVLVGEKIKLICDVEFAMS
ncbi:MAG: YceI family protein [Paludibacter sp.]|nr:YceI family protein [Paludibacter sp.]